MKAFARSLIAVIALGFVVHAQESSPGAKKPDTSEVPEKYEVGEDTISPDGRFAILYPIRQDMQETTAPNLLVRLKPFRILKDFGESAWQGMRGEPKATWSKDGDFVAVWHQMKWGNEDLVVYEIANDEIKREEKIWPEVLKYFSKSSKTDDTIGTFVGDDDWNNFKFKDHKLLLKVSADSQPNLVDGPHRIAELHGVWNLETAKFDRVHFKRGKKN